MTEDYDDDVLWNYERWIKPFHITPLWFWEVK
jgi:hypothetical protein